MADIRLTFPAQLLAQVSQKSRMVVMEDGHGTKITIGFHGQEVQ